MGHSRITYLPRTRRWREVIALIGSGDGTAASVASATLDAAEKSLTLGGADPGLVRVFWLLAKLPDAARSGSLGDELRQLGIVASATPTIAELAGGLASAIDDHLDAHRRRTDIAEMALGAAVESITKDLSRRTSGLFHQADDVAHELADLGGDAAFGQLAKGFFARFTERCLRYYVDRELPRHVGHGRRFDTLAAQGEFSKALELHCQQAATIVETFAGGWRSKARHERDLTEARAAKFVGYALKKIRDELRRGAAE